MIAICLRMGVAPRAEIETSNHAGYYLDLGVRHFCMGSDINILYDWLSEEGDAFHSPMGQAKAVAAG